MTIDPNNRAFFQELADDRDNLCKRFALGESLRSMKRVRHLNAVIPNHCKTTSYFVARAFAHLFKTKKEFFEHLPCLEAAIPRAQRKQKQLAGFRDEFSPNDPRGINRVEAIIRDFEESLPVLQRIQEDLKSAISAGCAGPGQYDPFPAISWPAEIQQIVESFLDGFPTEPDSFRQWREFIWFDEELGQRIEDAAKRFHSNDPAAILGEIEDEVYLAGLSTAHARAAKKAKGPGALDLRAEITVEAVNDFASKASNRLNGRPIGDNGNSPATDGPRRRGTRKAVGNRFLEEVPDSTPMDPILNMAIAGLPELEQVIMRLRLFGDSFEEVANHLNQHGYVDDLDLIEEAEQHPGWMPKKVRSVMRRIADSLRDFLPHDDDEEEDNEAHPANRSKATDQRSGDWHE